MCQILLEKSSCTLLVKSSPYSTPRIQFLSIRSAMHSCDDCRFLLLPFPSISPTLHHPPLSHCWFYKIIFPLLSRVCMCSTSLSPLTADPASELCHSSHLLSAHSAAHYLRRLPFTHSPLRNQLFHTPEMVGLPHINTPRFDHPPSLLTQLPSTISILFFLFSSKHCPPPLVFFFMFVRVGSLKCSILRWLISNIEEH